MATCKPCLSEKRKQQHHSDEKYRQRRIKSAKQYYQDHKEQVKAYVKQWMKEHPKCANHYMIKWQEENRDYYRRYIGEYKRKQKIGKN